MKKVITIVMILALMVSMSGCDMIGNIINPREIATVSDTEYFATEEETTAKKKKDEMTRTEFGENGELQFTEHNYSNIGIYAHDGVSTVELSGVHAILNKIITPEMSDIERIKAVHDWLVKNTTYEENYYELDDCRSFIYNLVYKKIALCQGYAVTFYVMMTELGIPCTIVSGYAGELHAWNAVKLDGAWYYVDVTWDDPALMSSDSNAYDDGYNMRYRYLLCTYDYISKTHTETEYRPKQPSPKGQIDSYNDLVYELAGYKGVYQVNEIDDIYEIAEAMSESGKYEIYVEGGMNSEEVATQLYYMLMLGYGTNKINGAHVVYSSDTITFEVY